MYQNNFFEPNVLKTRSNRSVQSVGPGTSDESGWVNLLKPLVGQNRNKIAKTRLNRPKPFEPNNRSWFCYTVWFRKIHQIDHFVKKHFKN
jgi:hypothetical protein